MLEATQKKLDEAQFFLRRLRAENRRQVRPEPEAFGYYLSALLSAGRSVTFAWQSEEKEKYDNWFSGWIEGRSEDERELLKLMNTQRVAAVHKGGVKTNVDWEYVPMVQLRQQGLPAHLINFSWMGENKIGIPVHQFDGTTLEVVEACERYLALLKEMIDDFCHPHPLR